jgi:hypothetical protein
MAAFAELEVGRARKPELRHVHRRKAHFVERKERIELIALVARTAELSSTITCSDTHRGRPASS